MTLEEIKSLAIHLLQHNNGGQNLIVSGWGFGFNKRKKAMGLCSYRKKMIYVSIHYKNNTEEQIKDTILHEIAHIYAGPRVRHGEEWKRWAKVLGATPESCGGSSKETEATLLKVANYTLTCPNCNYTIPYFRKPRRTKSCGKCSPFFDKRFAFIVKDKYGKNLSKKDSKHSPTSIKNNTITIGDRIKYNGEVFVVVGFDYRATKYKVVIENESKKKRFRCTTEWAELHFFLQQHLLKTETEKAA